MQHRLDGPPCPAAEEVGVLQGGYHERLQDPGDLSGEPRLASLPGGQP